MREQSWAKAWFPATSCFFNGWFAYSVLDMLFLKPYGRWHMPALVQTVGGVLFLIAAIVLTSAYAFWHLRGLVRDGIVPKLRVYHAIHGGTGLMGLGLVCYLVFRYLVFVC